jgi:hypothetical protein
MKKSRERRILIAVLSAAGVALLVDRVALDSGVTGPAESSASVLDGFPVEPALPGQDPSVDGLRPSISQATPASELAKRLREVGERFPKADPAQGRDAFTPAVGWSAQMNQGTPDNSAEFARAFQESHRLDAVMTIGDQRCAVIDGRTVFVGQALDGYKLLSVDQRSAVFEVGGARVKISIRADQGPS